VDGPVTIPINESRGQTRGNLQCGESSSKVARLGHFSFGVGANARIRQSVRGVSKRGRPRGSRRGGPIGGKGRGLLLMHPKGSNMMTNESSSTISLIDRSSNEQHGKYHLYRIVIYINKYRINDKNDVFANFDSYDELKINRRYINNKRQDCQNDL